MAFNLEKVNKFIPWIAGLLAFNSVYSNKTNGWSQLSTDLQNLPTAISDKLKNDYMKLVYAGLIFIVGIPLVKSLLKGLPSWAKSIAIGILIYFAVLEIAEFIDPVEAPRVRSGRVITITGGSTGSGGKNPFAL